MEPDGHTSTLSAIERLTVGIHGPISITDPIKYTRAMCSSHLMLNQDVNKVKFYSETNLSTHKSSQLL